MTLCSHGGCHDGRNVTRWYRIATSYSRARFANLCEDCARRENALMDLWVWTRRVDPERPYKSRLDRAKPAVAWFGRLRGRVETGVLV